RITGMDFTKVPGLDILSIQTIISETGINHNKWSTEKHFSSWLGLSPANKITGEKVFSTRTRKVINRAANAFRMAANSVGNSKSSLGAYYRRLKKRLGAPKAITAIARKIACIFYSMLKYGQEYVKKGMEYYEIRYKERAVKILIKKAREFGYTLVQQEELVKEVS
ncbi:transposase, partial [Wolbachia endosymbiont of Drosophila tsacasi]|uniref:transposase n=1 Tax=Wolbachia endosymbiont of Drosophila tsacasi TaxID=3002579 RepID=UPI0023AA1696